MQFRAIACAAALGLTLLSPAQTGGIKTITMPEGGHIFYGAIPSQPTPTAALGQTLHKLSQVCGDRPQLGKLLKMKSGDLVAVFFTVNAKSQDGRALAGLAIAYAPQSGTAGGAVLLDDKDRFPSTVNSMFERLKKEIAPLLPPPPASSGSPTPQTSAAPAATLKPFQFPDGSGFIGLPDGWSLKNARLGDVTAAGPNGEGLRFGWTIAVIDPTNPASRSLGAAPNFVRIPYSASPADAYKAVLAQYAQKARKPAPNVEIQKVQELPLQGGKNYMLYGDLPAQNGQPEQSLVTQLIITMPLTMGTWQITAFQFTAPTNVMANERATIGEIFPSYTRNNRYVNAVVNNMIVSGIEATNQFVSSVQKITDDSDRTTAGFSDFLRGQTVLMDTETGGHARTSDDLADLVTGSNPNRFQVVPLSDYIKGIDY